jgi:hypothetical protein
MQATPTNNTLKMFGYNSFLYNVQVFFPGQHGRGLPSSFSHIHRSFPLPTASTFHGVVGIAIRHGLDGLGIESRRGRDFPQPPRLALGPTQLSVEWKPGPIYGDKADRAWHYPPNLI